MMAGVLRVRRGGGDGGRVAATAAFILFELFPGGAAVVAEMIIVFLSDYYYQFTGQAAEHIGKGRRRRTDKAFILLAGNESAATRCTAEQARNTGDSHPLVVAMSYKANTLNANRLTNRSRAELDRCAW